jgi:hypothetical protein
MPRPDKRFIRNPGSGVAPPSGAGDASAPKKYVKGRYATVPRPVEPQPADPKLDDPAPAPAAAQSLPEEQVGKYDRRAGGVPVRRAAAEASSLESPVAAASEPEATEVVVDLRETATGFEAVYRRRPIDRDDAGEG